MTRERLAEIEGDGKALQAEGFDTTIRVELCAEVRLLQVKQITLQQAAVLRATMERHRWIKTEGLNSGPFPLSKALFEVCEALEQKQKEAPCKYLCPGCGCWHDAYSPCWPTGTASGYPPSLGELNALPTPQSQIESLQRALAEARAEVNRLNTARMNVLKLLTNAAGNLEDQGREIARLTARLAEAKRIVEVPL